MKKIHRDEPALREGLPLRRPAIPNTEEMLNLIQKALKPLPGERLWINPDCGLKTRQWAEVKAALANLVTVANIIRSLGNQ